MMPPRATGSDDAELPVLVLDGTSFDDLTGFFAAISQTLGLTSWGMNLDAFNDALRGGFATPDGGFILRWDHSDVSAARLGWPDHPVPREDSDHLPPGQHPEPPGQTAGARRHEGQNLLQIITGIVRAHGPDGIEADDNVHLLLH